jgi:hypothetical protein
MSSSLKYIAIILVAVVVLVFFFNIKSCGSANNAVQSTNVPIDSNFAPVTHQTYQPPSIPFLSKEKLPVKLPQGVKEKDVKKIIKLTVRDIPSGGKEINIIESKTGEIFVQRDSSIVSIGVIDVRPPLIAFDFRFGAGLSLGKCGKGLRYSPAVLFAPIEWDGWLQLPVVAADLDGIGPGAQIKIYHNIYLGAAQLWRYDVGQQSKIILSYVY